MPNTGSETCSVLVARHSEPDRYFLCLKHNLTISEELLLPMGKKTNPCTCKRDLHNSTLHYFRRQWTIHYFHSQWTVQYFHRQWTIPLLTTKQINWKRPSYFAVVFVATPPSALVRKRSKRVPHDVLPMISETERNYNHRFTTFFD
jgi:hypothetical protein